MARGLDPSFPHVQTFRLWLTPKFRQAWDAMRPGAQRRSLQQTPDVSGFLCQLLGQQANVQSREHLRRRHHTRYLKANLVLLVAASERKTRESEKSEKSARARLE